MIDKIKLYLTDSRVGVFDSEELTAIESIGRVIETTNELIDEVIKKTDKKGNHEGTWQGLRPSQTNESITSKVDQLDEHLLQEIERVDGLTSNLNQLDDKLMKKGEKIKTDHIINVMEYSHLTQIINGLVDWIPAFNKAIEDAELTKAKVIVPAGEYWVNVTEFIFIKPKTNTHIIFEKGAIVKVIPNSLTHYRVIEIFNVDNVEIENPVIVGENDAHIGVAGEWGHGINIINATNIKIINPKISKCWGDGVYIGISYDSNPNLPQTDTITIVNPIIESVRRNGISVCSGRNIVVENPICKNIRGTAPESGIDIEPEGSGGVKPIMENVRIINPRTENCKWGVVTVLAEMKDKGLFTDIVIENHHDKGSDIGYHHMGFLGRLDGSVKIINPTYINNLENGIKIENHEVINEILEIYNPQIINCNQAGTENVYVTDSAISLIRGGGYTSRPKIGNCHIFGIKVIDTRIPMKTSACFYSKDFSNIGIGKFTFVDSLELQSLSNGVTMLDGVIFTTDQKIRG